MKEQLTIALEAAKSAIQGGGTGQRTASMAALAAVGGVGAAYGSPAAGGGVAPETAIAAYGQTAGDDTGSGLPDGAYQIPNDARGARFIGAAPPAGHGEHRYFITVHALDVEDLGVPAEATPAFLNFNIFSHILGRATIVATAETPA